MERYIPKGVCSTAINFQIEDNQIKKIDFESGCDGSLKGISTLITGMDVDDAIARLSGITCGASSTSCPDQLAKALIEYTSEKR